MFFKVFFVICLIHVIANVMGQSQEEELIYGCYDYEVCVDLYYCQNGSIDGNTLERNYYYVSVVVTLTVN